MSSTGVAHRLLAGFVATTIASCNLVSSIGDFVVADCNDVSCDDAGTDTADSSGGTATGSDGGHAKDATSPPECPVLPSEWTWVKLLNAGDACSTGFKRTLLDHPRSSSDACECSCQSAPSNPCEPSGVDVKFNIGYSWSSCSGDGNTPAQGCFKGGVWSSSITKVSGSPTPPVNVECPAVATLPPVTDDGKFEICAAGSGTTTCGDDMCVLHEGGDATCPDGFPEHLQLADMEDIDDARSCGTTCACKTVATACVDAGLTLYTNDTCSEGGRTAVFDSACNPFDSSNFSVKSGQYRAKPNVDGCQPTSPTAPLTGTVTSKKDITLCCQTRPRVR